MAAPGTRADARGALGAGRRAGCCALSPAAYGGRWTGDTGCRNSLFYIHQMLDVCLIQTTTSGTEGNRGFMQAARFLSIFIGPVQRDSPPHPQSTPVPGRRFTRDCRKGKRKALQACRGHFS